MDETILSDLDKRSLANAVKTNLYGLIRDLVRSPCAEVFEQSGLMRWRTSIEHPWFNGVLCTEASSEDASRQVEDAVSYFRSHRVPAFSWWLAPELEPGSWARHLVPRGFRYDDSMPGMAVDLLALPASVRRPGNLVIERVETAPSMQEWARTYAAGNEMPASSADLTYDLASSLGMGLPYGYYLARLGDQPMAVSALFLSAGVAGIYFVATLPEARRQGIGGAVVLAPLLEARDRGYRAGILQSSNMGYSVYRRLGFERVCTVDCFVWPAG